MNYKFITLIWDNPISYLIRYPDILALFVNFSYLNVLDLIGVADVSSPTSTFLLNDFYHADRVWWEGFVNEVLL